MMADLSPLRVAGTPFAFSCDDVIWIVMELRFLLLYVHTSPLSAARKLLLDVRLFIIIGRWPANVHAPKHTYVHIHTRQQLS